MKKMKKFNVKFFRTQLFGQQKKLNNLKKIKKFN